VSDYAHPEVLISTQEVAARSGDPQLKVLEVDEDTEAYQRGHIAGAQSLHWRDELQDPLRRGVIDKAAFEKLFGSKGVSADSDVVLYGGNNNWFAAYALWYLRYYGHKKVRLMDGGRKKWELEGRPLTTDVSSAEPASYVAGEPDWSIRIRRDDVLQAIGGTPMVDVRSPEEYTGVLAAPAHLPQEQAQRNGHIPGARNIPWSRAAREDGSFKTADELRALYLDDAGLPADGPVITYCRVGERSAHTWVVLHELLGNANVKNYDGSWTEYGSLVDVPIER
jgi:thiosulfate/3-mercaptopyruvate sulfurtransferase